VQILISARTAAAALSARGARATARQERLELQADRNEAGLWFQSLVPCKAASPPGAARHLC